MFLRKIALTNVRSFLARTELELDGAISIVIGPNGGGKTNLLDAVVMTLRRHLQADFYFTPQPTQTDPDKHAYAKNDITANMVLEKHSSGSGQPQTIEVELEITARDIENIIDIKSSSNQMMTLMQKYGAGIDVIHHWEVSNLQAGTIYTFKIIDGVVSAMLDRNHQIFFEYIYYFEIISFLRQKLLLPTLSVPIFYLPIGRSQNGLQSTVQLGGFNYSDQKRQIAGTHSKQNFPLFNLALSRLAAQRRSLEHEGKGNIDDEFNSDPELMKLTGILRELGYEWSIECTNIYANQYDLRLKKTAYHSMQVRHPLEKGS